MASLRLTREKRQILSNLNDVGERKSRMLCYPLKLCFINTKKPHLFIIMSYYHYDISRKKNLQEWTLIHCKNDNEFDTSQKWTIMDFDTLHWTASTKFHAACLNDFQTEII